MIYPDRVCTYCTAAFTPIRADQERCSSRCKVKWMREQCLVAYFTPELLDELKAEAKRLDRSISWVAQRCVKSAMRKGLE